MAKGTVNKVILIGRLGGDPEIKQTPQGQAVCTLTLATNEGYKDQSGSWVERTEWHRIVLWRFLAENAGKYLKKGSQVYVEGKLQTRNWDDENGQKHYSTEIVVREMNFLGGTTNSSEGQTQVYVPTNSENVNQGNATYDIPYPDENELPF